MIIETIKVFTKVKKGHRLAAPGLDAQNHRSAAPGLDAQNHRLAAPGLDAQNHRLAAPGLDAQNLKCTVIIYNVLLYAPLLSAVFETEISEI